jgi:hypothetical protein
MLLRKSTTLPTGARKSERRKNPRKALDDNVLLMVLTGESDVLERASILDISADGVCLNKVEPVKGYAQDRVHIVPDQPVMAYFRNHPLTLYGTISRINDATGQLAFRVKRSNNEDLWESLCHGE